MVELRQDSFRKVSFKYEYIQTNNHKKSVDDIRSGCNTKFCDRDFVLKSVVMGEKKDFQVESGLFRDLFRRTSGLYSLFS